MRIEIINGPNINILGKRETNIYGDRSFDEYLGDLKSQYYDIEIGYFQSNIEGEIVTHLQKIGFSTDAIILNAAAYSHTSIAILDAIRAIKAPVIEVHISNIFAREKFRHKSVISTACKGVISGFKLDSYRLAIEAIKNGI